MATLYQIKLKNKNKTIFHAYLGTQREKLHKKSYDAIGKKSASFVFSSFFFRRTGYIKSRRLLGSSENRRAIQGGSMTQNSIGIFGSRNFSNCSPQVFDFFCCAPISSVIHWRRARTPTRTQNMTVD